MNKVMVLTTESMQASLLVVGMRRRARKERYPLDIDVFAFDEEESLGDDVDLCLVDSNFKTAIRRLENAHPTIRFVKLHKGYIANIDDESAYLYTKECLESKSGE